MLTEVEVSLTISILQEGVLSCLEQLPLSHRTLWADSLNPAGNEKNRLKEERQRSKILFDITGIYLNTMTGVVQCETEMTIKRKYTPSWN